MKKKPLYGLIPILAAVGIYTGGVSYFQTRFLPNTLINGINVSKKTVQTADDMLKPNIPPDLTVAGKDNTSDTIKMTDINYEVYNTESSGTILDQQKPTSWIKAVFSKQTYEIETGESYDENALQEAINKLSILQNQQEPQNAHLQKNGSEFEIIPEDDGNAVDQKKTLEVIKKAVDEKQSEVNLVDEDCYLKAEVTSDSEKLQKKLKKIEKFLKKKVTIDLTDAEEVLDKDTLIDAISEKGKIDLSDEFIKEYVDKLCEKYETYQVERPFHTTTGEDIYVGGSPYDTYGFWMDRDATVSIIKEALDKDEPSTVKPEWKVWSLTRDQSNGDIGNTYAEVNKDKQHMWMYVDGNMVLDADVVTGLPTPERETPSGLFRVLLKDKNHTMQDESYAGTAHCERWMALTWQGVGFHDASWQSSFGGDRYKTAGSHGCINLSVDTAVALYDLLDNNVPVVIY